jgi:hypothetical protein
MFDLDLFEFIIAIVLIGSVAGIVQQGIKLERDKIRAGRREAFAHRTAQLARAADDDRDFAAKRKERI